MAITRLKPTGVNTSDAFTLANLTVTGNVTSSNANLGNLVTANYSSGVLTTAEQPNITSVGSLANLTVSGQFSMQQAAEVTSVLSYTAGTTINHDYSTGAVFTYNANITGNFTANITNLPTTNNRVIVIGLFLNQGSTAGYANVVQIDGVGVTIKWGNGTTPTPTINKSEVQSLTLLRTGSAWTVYGQYSSFG